MNVNIVTVEVPTNIIVVSVVCEDVIEKCSSDF